MACTTRKQGLTSTEQGSRNSSIATNKTPDRTNAKGVGQEARSHFLKTLDKDKDYSCIACTRTRILLVCQSLAGGSLSPLSTP